MTSISENVYIDKLDDIVNEYNNTYHRTIKKKPVDVTDNACINIGEEVNDKILILKLVIELSEYRIRKTFLLKDIVFMVKKVKNTVL